MSKEKSVSICPKCGKIDKLIKYGKRNNIQRYKCKRCNHVFPEKRKRVKYLPNEKTLLAILISLMNSEKGNLSQSALKNVPNILKEINNYELIEKQSTNSDVIFCNNPRILICDNGYGSIVLVRMSNNKRTSKQIKIIDEGYIVR